MYYFPNALFVHCYVCACHDRERLSDEIMTSPADEYPDAWPLR